MGRVEVRGSKRRSWGYSQVSCLTMASHQHALVSLGSNPIYPTYPLSPKPPLLILPLENAIEVISIDRSRSSII